MYAFLDFIMTAINIIAKYLKLWTKMHSNTVWDNEKQ